jgi:hypothetical protein
VNEVPELLPCPFCGGEAKLVSNSSSTVQCQNDQCIIGDPSPFNDFSHREDAITAWNARPSSTPSTEAGVAQVDREAAAKRMSVNTEAELFYVNDVRLGLYDGDPDVKAFARHRHEATASLRAENERLREALIGVRAWTASLTVCDMNEIVADGGITAGMVVGQEATEQVRRIDRVIAGSHTEEGRS